MCENASHVSKYLNLVNNSAKPSELNTSCVSNSNVKIRIAGSSDRPQKCHELSHGKMHVSSRPMECKMTSLIVDGSTVSTSH